MPWINNHIKSFLVIPFCIFMILIQGGVSLYTHHCSSRQAVEHSILIPSSGCCQGASDSMADCDQSNVNQSCCAHSVPVQKTPKDCCTDTEQSFKLLVETIFNHSVPQIVMPFVQLTFGTNIESIFDKDEGIAILGGLYENHSSPPLSAPEYLSFIQVYRI